MLEVSMVGSHNCKALFEMPCIYYLVYLHGVVRN
jgi:hypothetical protein